MYAGKLVFAQVMEYAPWHTFRRLVTKFRGDFNVRSFSCLDQFLCMAFAQLAFPWSWASRCASWKTSIDSSCIIR